MLRPSKVLISALLAAVTGFAQNPVPPVPTPLPGTPAAARAANPAAPGQEQLVQLQFPNTDVKDVLDFYSKLTKRKLIFNNQLVGSVYLVIADVTATDAIKLIEMSLGMNGFFIVPSEDPTIWKVTGVGTNPKSVGVPFIDKEENLPADEQVVMFLFKLKHHDPTELAQTLSTGVLVPNQLAQFTTVVPLPKANSLLVTETTSIIRTLIRVVRAIDEPPAEVVSEFISLTHAQAEDVVANLEKLFEKTQTQQTTGAPGAPGVAGQPRVQRTVTDGQGNPLPTTSGAPADGSISIEINGGTMGVGPTEDNIVIGKVKLTADKRTNRIHIVSRPINMNLIRELVTEYDANVKLPEPFVFPLRYRPVGEVMDAIVSAIADPGERSGAAGAAGTTPGAAGQRPGVQAGGQAAGAAGANRFGGAGGAAGGFDAGGGAGALGETLEVQQVETTLLSQQVGKSTVIADQRNNSIMIVGTQDVKDKVLLLLRELDVPQAQVMIHTVIGELRLNRTEQFGLEYILRNGGVLTSAGVGTGTDPGTGTPTTGNTAVVGFNDAGQGVLNLNNLLSQQNVTNILTGGSSGLSGFIMSGNSFDAVVKAFESNNRFRVVTRPSIFTSNAKRAIITSGEEVPVPTSIQSSFATGNAGNLATNSTIQFKPIELRLEVLPLINDDKEVSLEIVQNISERAGSTIIDNNAIPNISRRAIKTYVTVPNNGTLILGGLIKESKDFSRNGILGLSRLPLIGPLFGTTSKDKIRTELIVMMRPVVTFAPGDTARLREKTFEAFAIPPDLESAIMPVGVWDKIPRAKIVAPVHRSTAPTLRAEPSRDRLK